LNGWRCRYDGNSMTY